MFHKGKALLSVLLLGGFFLSSYQSNADTLDNVLMPDALLIGRINITKIQQSPITKLIKTDDTVSSEIKVDEINSILKKYNLSDKDFTDFVFGLKLDTDRIKNFNDALLNEKNREFVFGIQTSKSVSLKLLKNIILDSSKQAKGSKVVINAEDKDGIKILVISEKGNSSTQSFALTVQAGEKIIIGGSPKSVVSSAKRVKSGENVVFGPKLAKLKSDISSKTDLYIVSYVPDSIRRQVGLAVKKTTPADPNTNNINVDVLKDINALSIQADFKSKLNVNILSYFMNRTSAIGAQKLVNNFLPIVKFMAMSSAKGLSLPVLDSIGCDVSKTTPQLKLHFTVTEDDIKSLQSLVKKDSKPPPPKDVKLKIFPERECKLTT